MGPFLTKKPYITTIKERGGPTRGKKEEAATRGSFDLNNSSAPKVRKQDITSSLARSGPEQGVGGEGLVQTGGE